MQSITVISSMSYDPVAHMDEIEAKGDVSRGDWYRMIMGHEEQRINKQREMEKRENEKRDVYNQIEAEDQKRADIREQREQLMRTSTFKAASIMPQVKSLVADKQFVTSGIAGRAVIGDDIFHAKGGRRRTRHNKRSGGKKRSYKKRMSRRR